MNYSMKKSKGILALMVITVVLLSTLIPLQAFAAVKLSDIAGSWAEKEITAWVDKGFINGYPDGTFKPNNNITRAEFVALVNRVFKFSETAEITFKDVKDTDWFSNDFAKAEKAGYLSELKETGSFILRENITRQEVAVIIFKLKSLTKDENKAGNFTDAEKITDFFKGYIGAVKKAGYMQGYPDGSFGPEKNLTRAEAVVSINNILGIAIEDIPEQTAYVGSYSYVKVKTDPADAELSAKSSDETVLTAGIAGREVKIKGVKEGTATVTVSAKKENFFDKEISFTVKVKRYSGGGGGGGSKSGGGDEPGGGGNEGGGEVTPPENKAPVITVIEPDGVNDGIITLTQGDVFIAPTVTAIDPEDGDITSSIVKTGEDEVDTSTVGDYILTYNVKDSQGLAAAEVKVTVRVVRPELYAEGTVEIATIGNTKVARVTLTKASIGKSFKSVDTGETADIGKYLQLIATNKAKADFELLDPSGLVVGKFSVELKAGSFTVSVEAVPAPELKASGNIQIAVIGNTKVARITVEDCNAGKLFRSVVTKEVAEVGNYLQIIATNAETAEFEVLDASGSVVGKFTVNIAAGSFTVPVVKVEVPPIKIEGTVAVAIIGNTTVVRITFTSATAGSSIKSLDTKEVAPVGEYLQLIPKGATKAGFELLDASGNVLGTFEVTLTAGTFSVLVSK